MNNHKNVSNAYITVEASIIVPIVMSILFALLYKSFIVHDTGLIMMKLDSYIEKECRSISNGMEKWNTGKIAQTIESSINKHLFLCNVQNTECEEDATSVAISTEIKTKVTLGLVNRLTLLSNKRYIKCSMIIPDYCTTKRNARIIKKVKVKYAKSE